MTRAEERALELYPPIQYDRNNEVVRNGYDNQTRKIFIKGYQQAEKDLALTWEDIKCIANLWHTTNIDYGINGKELSLEVLKKFNDHKKLK